MHLFYDKMRIQDLKKKLKLGTPSPREPASDNFINIFTVIRPIYARNDLGM